MNVLHDKVKIKRVRPKAIIPTKGSSKSAGWDLYACLDNPVRITPGKTQVIPTGLSIQPPDGVCALIFARSGLAARRGLRPANCVGLCDEDYRGEYMVALHNDSPNDQIIEHGDRIAQLVFQLYFESEFEEVESLDETDRGSGGFGSTGV